MSSEADHPRPSATAAKDCRHARPGMALPMHALAAVILLAATLLPRVHHLGVRSFWFDPAFSVWNALGARPGRFLDTVQPFSRREWEVHGWDPIAVCDSVRVTENTPPLYFLLLSVWMRLFGTSEVAVRSLSVTAGTLSVLLLLAGARRFFGPRVGWTAAWLLALSPMHIYFSRESRNYALACCISVPMLFALLRAQEQSPAERSGARAWLAYSLWSTLGLYTNYMFGILMMAQGLVLAVRRRPLVGWAAAALGSLVLFTPWLAYGLESQMREAMAYRDAMAAVDPWFRNTFFFGAKLLLYLALGETGLRGLLLERGFLSVPVVLLLTWSAWGLLRPARPRQQEAVGLILGGAAVYLLGAVLACLAARQWMLVQTRFALFLLPGLCLVVALGALAHGRRGLLGAAALVILYGSLQLTHRQQYLARPYGNWRAVAATVLREARPGDLVMLNSAGAAVPFNWYYRGDLPQLGLPRLDGTREARARQVILQHPRIWLLSNRLQIDPDTRDRLLQGYQPVSSQLYGPSVDLTLFRRQN